MGVARFAPTNAGLNVLEVGDEVSQRGDCSRLVIFIYQVASHL